VLYLFCLSVSLCWRKLLLATQHSAPCICMRTQCAVRLHAQRLVYTCHSGRLLTVFLFHYLLGGHVARSEKKKQEKGTSGKEIHPFGPRPRTRRAQGSRCIFV